MRTKIALVTSLAALLAAAPLSLTAPNHLSHAFAKGGGEGGGGGNGGGNAGGNANGRDGSPGNSANAPGHTGERGNSANAPGQAVTSPVLPGNSNRGQASTNRGNSTTQTATVRSNDRARAEARSKAANELGNLNAAHASATARANASPNSMVGRIATYENQMHAALAIQDPAARNAAITQAREQLAQSANKSLTPTAVARVDSLLGIEGAPPQLGAVR